MKHIINIKFYISVAFMLMVLTTNAQTFEQENYINRLKIIVPELYNNAQSYFNLSVAPVQEQLNAIPPDVSKEQLEAMIVQRDNYVNEQEKLTAEISTIRTSVNSYLSTLLSSRCDPQAVAALKGYIDPLSNDQLDLLSQYENYSIGLKSPLETLKNELERNDWAKLDESSAALQQFDKDWGNSSYIFLITNNDVEGIPFLNDCVKRVMSLRIRGFVNCKTDMEQLIQNLTPSAGLVTNPAQYIEQISRGTAISQRLVELNQGIGRLKSQLSTISDTNERFNKLDKQRYDVVENWYDMREELDSVLLAACKYCLSYPCDTVGAFTWLRGEVEPMLEMVFHKSYKVRRDSYLTLMADYDRYTTEVEGFLKRMNIYTKAGQITDETKKNIISLLQSLDYYKNYYVKSREPKGVSSPYIDGILGVFEQMLANNFVGENETLQQLNENLRGDYPYYLDLENAAKERELEILGNQTFKVNGVSFTMIFVKGGIFTMGATSDQDRDARDDEKPAHRVTLSSFAIGQTEVTQALWQAVMGDNPSKYKGKKRPVECVSWDDCQKFIKRLNELTGKNFRLPTEAEWEYAARGGNKSHGYKYSGSNYIDDVAWYGDFFNGKTHDVATKQPNELGIYDMSGNVNELCQDWYDSNYYSSSPSSNPTGPNSGSYRAERGGNWGAIASYCRIAHRFKSDVDIRLSLLGFRLAL